MYRAIRVPGCITISLLRNGSLIKVARLTKSLGSADQSRTSRQGAATVEFAVTAPLLFLVLFCIVEFGRAMMVQHALVSASREACRVVVLDGKVKGDAELRVSSMLSAAGITGYNVAYTPDPPSSAKPSQPVTVTIQVPFSEVTWLPVPEFLRNTHLKESTTFAREGSH